METKTKLKPKRALIVGGTRGIGAALADRLTAKNWKVTATGRKQFDIGSPTSWESWADSLEEDTEFGLVIFSAGELVPGGWSEKNIYDYERSYSIHCAGPITFLAEYKDIIPWWAKIVFISSVGAVDTGIVDLSYGCAKAALEKAAKALARALWWDIRIVRLDLVETQMIRDLPPATMMGRMPISPQAAAQQIIDEAEI
jgi:NAD(P)-dependent dehydrogenase (short-subunit alcohol dehydrogenase family)